jgi:Predicted solute binding protein
MAISGRADTITLTNTNQSGAGNFDPAFNGAPLPSGIDGFVSEYFDNVTPPELPIGWTAINAIDPDGILWVTSDSGDPQPPADSPPNAAFINDPDAISDKYLYSPPITIVPVGTSFLEFRHNYNLEASDVDPNVGFDGGVLEVSVDGGPFQDLGGSVLSGGYDRTISTVRGSPIAGRQAWSGNSGGFITTLVDVSFNGHTIVLRWRMASDESTSSQGWRIDSVYIFGERPTPSPTPPITPTPTATITPTPTPTATATPRVTPRPRLTPHPRPTPR